MEQDRPEEKISEQGEEMTEESFLKDLYLFMKQRDTPIERIPHLGFKQIDMFLMYKTVKELGGYQQVTAQQLWKKVYNILGGNPRSTSAATCTRRHYEKLLLPYECHQAGYGDKIIFRTPRTQKRFHPGTYGEFEHEYPRNGKRMDFRHIPAFPPTSPNLFVDPQRPMFSLPLNIASYFPRGNTSLPNYITYHDSTPPNLSLNLQEPQPPRTPAPYFAEPSEEVQSCKHSLEMLRYLANKYKSSAGLEEPLNLSCKETTIEASNDTPSSFGPPSSKKPKFLNEASPLYSPRGLSPEQGADEAETTEATSRPEPTPAPADVIDLTSSAHHPVPRRASPPSVHLFNRRNYPEALAMKREQNQHLDWQKEEASTPHALPNRMNPLGHQATDSNGNMEIQIPLFLLQELIKRGLVSSPALSGHRPTSQDPPKAQTPPEPKLHVRSQSETSESSNKSKEPEDLSLRSPLRKFRDASQQDKQRSFGSPEELKSQSIISPFQLNNLQTSGFSFDRDTISRHYHPKQQAPIIRNQDQMAPISPKYSEDTPLSLTMKSGIKSEKVVTSPMTGKEISSSPPLLQVTTDHLKLLLANLPYRLERGQTF